MQVTLAQKVIQDTTALKEILDILAQKVIQDTTVVKAILDMMVQ